MKVQDEGMEVQEAVKINNQLKNWARQLVQQNNGPGLTTQ